MVPRLKRKKESCSHPNYRKFPRTRSRAAFDRFGRGGSPEPPEAIEVNRRYLLIEVNRHYLLIEVNRRYLRNSECGMNT